MKQKEIVLKISPDGKEVIFLYSDGMIDTLGDMGTVKVMRASNVRFDEKDQMWKVYIINDDGTEQLVPKVQFKHRKDAIDFEIDVLQKLLKENSEAVNQLFKEEINYV